MDKTVGGLQNGLVCGPEYAGAYLLTFEAPGARYCPRSNYSADC
jgi:hypothetical protein